MKTRTKKGWCLGAALLALLGTAARRAEASASTSTLNIEVAITATKSVTIDGVSSASDTASVNWTQANQVVVAPSTMTVKNTSGIL
ncbi:MAG: hypothetical protein ACHQ49_11535, partial [Elusimicrobiota bacterium]